MVVYAPHEVLRLLRCQRDLQRVVFGIDRVRLKLSFSELGAPAIMSLHGDDEEQAAADAQADLDQRKDIDCSELVSIFTASNLEEELPRLIDVVAPARSSRVEELCETMPFARLLAYASLAQCLRCFSSTQLRLTRVLICILFAFALRAAWRGTAACMLMGNAQI